MTDPTYTPNWGRDRDGQSFDQDVERKRRKYNAERERLGLGPGDANVTGYTRLVWDAVWGFFR